MKIRELNKTIFGAILIFSVIQVATFLSFEVFNRGARLLIISGIWLIITIPAFFITKSKMANFVYMLLNAVITGVTIAAYFLHEGKQIYNIVPTGLYFIWILAINHILLNSFRNKKRVNIITAIISGAGFVYGLYMWINNDGVMGSIIVFTSIILLCMNYSINYYLHFNREFEYASILKLFSMLMFGCVFFVVLTAISEGETLEFLGEAFDIDIRKPKKR